MEKTPQMLKELWETGERENKLFVYVFIKELLILAERLYNVFPDKNGEIAMTNLNELLENIRKKI